MKTDKEKEHILARWMIELESTGGETEEEKETRSNTTPYPETAHDLLHMVRTLDGKTDKQVISGYHYPVCIKCKCELHPETNGVGVLDMADFGPCELYDADLWKCPSCDLEVIGGFGSGPVAAHYLTGFQQHIDFYESKGLLVRNKG